MHPLIDLWPFPSIPGPSDWLKSIAGMIFDSQIGMLKFAMSLIFGSNKATLGILDSDWFSYQLGGWTNLGLNLVSLVIVLLGALVVIRLNSDHSYTYGRLIRSIAWLAVFVRLFYPAVGLASQTEQQLFDWMAKHFAGGSSSDLEHSLTTLASPTDVVGMFFGAIIGWVITFAVVCVCLGLLVVTLGVILLYPVIIVLSPLGRMNGFLARAFHWANAILATVVLSPILMFFWLSLSVAGISHAKDLLAVGSSYVGIAIENVAFLLCVATPITILYLAYQASTEVFGRTDTMLRNTVDIGSSRPLSFREARSRIDANRSSVLKKAATTVVVASMDDKRGEPLSHRLADVVAMGALRAGHPEVAAVAQLAKRRIGDSPKPKPPQAKRR